MRESGFDNVLELQHITREGSEVTSPPRWGKRFIVFKEACHAVEGQPPAQVGSPKVAKRATASCRVFGP